MADRPSTVPGEAICLATARSDRRSFNTYASGLDGSWTRTRSSSVARSASPHLTVSSLSLIMGTPPPPPILLATLVGRNALSKLTTGTLVTECPPSSPFTNRWADPRRYNLPLRDIEIWTGTSCGAASPPSGKRERKVNDDRREWASASCSGHLTRSVKVRFLGVEGRGRDGTCVTNLPPSPFEDELAKVATTVVVTFPPSPPEADELSSEEAFLPKKDLDEDGPAVSRACTPERLSMVTVTSSGRVPRGSGEGCAGAWRSGGCPPRARWLGNRADISTSATVPSCSVGDAGDARCLFFSTFSVVA
mmetsp:Transcript_17774/g.40783  ORF Transcript_17774/g.40783 Transcript_17774/m.40783 type:complete len:306 (-) Transcript_17774:73-990(-)